MDILIKNMEMPKNCNGCKLATHYFTNTHKVRCFINAEMREADDIDSRPKWCPLVALPEHHGRLGDLDAIRDKLSRNCPCVGCERFREEGLCMQCQYDRFAEIIEKEPTIVEATE